MVVDLSTGVREECTIKFQPVCVGTNCPEYANFIQEDLITLGEVSACSLTSLFSKKTKEIYSIIHIASV
jgi:hypothetical protein